MANVSENPGETRFGGEPLLEEVRSMDCTDLEFLAPSIFRSFLERACRVDSNKVWHIQNEVETAKTFRVALWISTFLHVWALIQMVFVMNKSRPLCKPFNTQLTSDQLGKPGFLSPPSPAK